MRTYELFLHVCRLNPNLDRVQSSDGLSSGVQGILPVDDTAFPGEFVDSYELGAKTTWLGCNLLLNTTLFYQDFSDFQLNNFLGTSFVVRAIPTVVSRGIDTEILWQGAVPCLMLQGGLSYTDTAYGDGPLPDADLTRLPGSRLSFAPRWSANLSLTYEHALGNQLTGRFNLGAKYSSDYNAGTDLDPQKSQPGYTLLNARLGIGADDKR
ncbi:TonB-dependent outer membrane receptor precursor [Xanthomonas fragariae]|uniref:TonB dependent receptor n=1 Tax=Xanthomonas fragariae TaxID=48664 RepID=A0A1Y6HAJ7_9XANT|nr:TonB-dependent receptor [Xanthomonas fragariae]SMQ99561.1 TonB dependent receptor [Xanthomonas fragariae]SMR03594.1 TonB-dependent outer membrane receptor precursor [Xanthomonas fragariae]